jgi:hypothetical protein
MLHRPCGRHRRQAGSYTHFVVPTSEDSIERGRKEAHP